ncbi:hypothetical protein [Advenella mimigardefordensis]|uniref:hypothetical protein n=1 Tax=Advenella mimigardefordensis TaxID=302406 RepID=UPI001181EA06|nr:hypothetical protein [Advenella mimigardefordensis]
MAAGFQSRAGNGKRVENRRAHGCATCHASAYRHHRRCAFETIVAYATDNALQKWFFYSIFFLYALFCYQILQLVIHLWLALIAN